MAHHYAAHSDFIASLMTFPYHIMKSSCVFLLLGVLECNVVLFAVAQIGYSQALTSGHVAAIVVPVILLFIAIVIVVFLFMRHRKTKVAMFVVVHKRSYCVLLDHL